MGWRAPSSASSAARASTMSPGSRARVAERAQSLGRTVRRDPHRTVGGKPVAFLPRHGRGHRFSPSDINYRANIDA